MHRMFEQFTDIIGIHEAALNEYEVRINKWDDQPKDFMLSVENKIQDAQRLPD